MPDARRTDHHGDLPSGTVTFLLSDVEGSTALWEADPEAMAAAMARHEQLMASAIAQHGGARPLEQGEGDNVVAVFRRATDAAAAALVAQAGLQGEPWIDDVVIRVRMGLHTGEAHLVNGTSYAGPDLNRCARIRSLACGGQILVSRTTHDLLSGHPPGQSMFIDVGTHLMKGIEEPEQVYQLCHPLLEDRSPPLRGHQEVPTNLRIVPTDLVGRDDELAELLTLGDAARLITITGAGGAGKTRLALALAEVSLATNPDGVWWVDLSPMAEPGLVAPELLAVLGERRVDDRPLEALVSAMAPRTCLVVLDNAEHLLDECTELVTALLTRTPSVRIVVTSREPLGAEGEWSWRIPSLVFPAPDDDVEQIMATSAVQLFVARARQARVGFRVTPEVAPHVAAICRRLDGLPLGIELAAARVRMMSPERIAAGLDDRFRLLTSGGRRAVARQQTLEASVEWSHSLLDDREQTLFRRLAVFAGGFSIGAAEQVVSGDDLDSYAILDLLTRLVDKSLVVADLDGSEARFRLLETMRQFAHDRLLIAGEVEAARDAHLAWCVQLAAEAERHLTGHGQREWLDRIERDHDNVRAACDWAWATGDGRSLWSIVGSLPLLWVLHGHFTEARHRYEQAEQLASTATDVDLRRGRWGSAYVDFCAGDFRRARQTTLDLVAAAEQADDDRLVGRGLTLLGVLAFGDPSRSRGLLTDAAALAAKAGDTWGECDALQKLAGDHVLGDEQRLAAGLLDLSGPLAVSLGSHPLLAIDAALRAHIELRTGHLDEARRAARRAVDQAALCGDLTDAGLAFVVEGEVGIRQGRAMEAIPLIRDRLDRCTSAGANMLVPGLKALLALAVAAAGDPTAALAVLDDTRTPSGGVFGRRSFARAVIELALGHGREAASIARGQRADIDPTTHPVRCAEIDVLLATIETRDGETKHPAALAQQALQVGLTGPYPALVADAAVVLATVAELEGDDESAARILGAAAAVMVAHGATCSALGAIIGPPDLDQLCRRLGRDPFDRAWAEGSELSLPDLVAYLSRARGSHRRAAIGWDSLTPTELQVVELVAEGLTNKAIGERLFVTGGTVKSHLAHVYAKLGAANRAEVAAEVARRAVASPLDHRDG